MKNLDTIVIPTGNSRQDLERSKFALSYGEGMLIISFLELGLISMER
jgi:hypothetical protein